MLLPMGGHKGIGIAMMVECLAGALAATANSLESDRNAIPKGGAPGRQGTFLWLVRPGAFADAAVFGDYMAEWTASYLDAGGDDARLPGARGDRLEREGRANGIELPDIMEQELRSVGTRLRIPFPP
jgi:LDH2 family malate/lactate/ureidoglycolate dehydrogenase